MSNASVAYWANADINLAADPDDIVYFLRFLFYYYKKNIIKINR